MEDDNPLLQHATLSFFEVVRWRTLCTHDLVCISITCPLDYQQVSTLSADYDIPQITVPSHAFVFQLCLSSSGMAISRMCGILLRYHLAFEDISERPEDWRATYSKEYVDIFNSIVMDVCNAIWRNRALNTTDRHANGLNLPLYVRSLFLVFTLLRLSDPLSTSRHVIEQLNDLCQSRNQNATTALSITHSAALAGFSMRFMEVRETITRKKKGIVAEN